VEPIKVSTSLVCLEYPKNDVLVGNSNIPLTVTIISFEKNPLKLVSIAQAAGPGERLILFEMPGEEVLPDEGGVLKTIYRGRFAVGERAEPGGYPIVLKLKYRDGDATPDDKIVRLEVGGHGAVRLVDDSLKPITCMTNEAKTVNLKLKTDYPGYPVHLRRVIVTSEPADLVRAESVPVDLHLRSRKEVGTVPVTFTVRKMQAKDWILGLSEGTLELQFEYEDGAKRVLTARDSLKFKVTPSLFVLGIALLFGVGVGAAVKTYMKYMEAQGFTRAAQVRFIGITVFIGILATLVAIIGRVQVSVFQFNGSYDDPKVLFMISLAATVGPQLLYVLFKSKAPSVGDGGGQRALDGRRQEEVA
jgi:hypothetical protein